MNAPPEITTENSNSTVPESFNPATVEATLQQSFEGNSQWADLTPQDESLVMANSESLHLSATSLSTYMSCPRQYFYSKVLNLKTPQYPAALIGALVHALMEEFNNRVNDGEPYTATFLSWLNQQLFEGNTDIFQQWLLDDLASLSLMAQRDLQQRIIEIIDDLQLKSFFNQPPAKILPEIGFRFSLPEVPDAVFTGKIDALIQWQNGLWDVVDYKHYNQRAFDQKNPAKRIEKLMRVFDPLPTEAETHSEQFPNHRERNYQIPLYAWATEQDSKLKTTLADTVIGHVTIQLLRPTFNGDNGSVPLSIEKATIDTATEQLKQDLLTGFVTPIKKTKTFAVSDDPPCDFCAYSYICDGQDIQQEGDDS